MLKFLIHKPDFENYCISCLISMFAKSEILLEITGQWKCSFFTFICNCTSPKFLLLRLLKLLVSGHFSYFILHYISFAIDRASNKFNIWIILQCTNLIPCCCVHYFFNKRQQSLFAAFRHLNWHFLVRFNATLRSRPWRKLIQCHAAPPAQRFFLVRSQIILGNEFNSSLFQFIYATELCTNDSSVTSSSSAMAQLLLLRLSLYVLACATCDFSLFYRVVPISSHSHCSTTLPLIPFGDYWTAHRCTAHPHKLIHPSKTLLVQLFAFLLRISHPTIPNRHPQRYKGSRRGNS